MLGVYIAVWVSRYLVIQKVNSKRLLSKSIKENSFSFLKRKNISYTDEAQSWIKKYNLLTAFLWIFAIIALLIAFVVNVGRL